MVPAIHRHPPSTHTATNPPKLKAVDFRVGAGDGANEGATVSPKRGHESTASGIVLVSAVVIAARVLSCVKSTFVRACD